MMTAERLMIVAAGVRIRRNDGQVLLVRHRSGIAAGRWSVPFAAVADDEVAESVATRLLRDVLRLDPGLLQFAETLTVPAGDEDIVINVFDAIGWTGEPRYSGQDFDDAGWVDSAALDGLDVQPEVAAWLGGHSVSAPIDDPHDEIVQALIEACAELLAAYDAIPVTMRERLLDGTLAPVDVLHHLAAREAYTADEALRFAETPGHPWREFNEDQAEAERRIRRRLSDAEARSEVVAAHDDTLRILDALMPEQLAHIGPHPRRGTTAVRDQFTAIAEYDRERTDQLRAMLDSARRLLAEGGH